VEPGRKSGVCNADQCGFYGCQLYRIDAASGQKRIDAARGAEPDECLGNLAGWKNVAGDGGPPWGISERGLLDAATKKLTWVTD